MTPTVRPHTVQHHADSSGRPLACVFFILVLWALVLGTLVLGALVLGGLVLGGLWSTPVAAKGVSGYDFADPSTQAMQDDDFENPAFLWVERARTLWLTPEATDRPSCASCHGAVEQMRGVATGYPTTDPKSGQFVNLEGRINLCRQAVGLPVWEQDSDPLLAMTALIRLQSRGLPMAVSIDGANARWFAAGEALYHQPLGQLDLSCADCHQAHAGAFIRAEHLSQGQSNGFPTYRLKWQTLGSLHRRFRECNRNIRAEPWPAGADPYLALELYLAWLGQGLPLEAPAVRK